MKDIILKILKEEVSNIETKSEFDQFYTKFKSSYGKEKNIDSIFINLVKDIKNSPTPRITMVKSRFFCGMSLTDNVMLSEFIFNESLYKFIYILFHEIAHQYQYKKYGKDILYTLANQEINNKTLDSLIKIEQVADRFGVNMANKYAKNFDLPKMKIVSPYDNVGTGRLAYKMLLLKIQDEIKKGNITCVEQMESYLTSSLTQ
jgi:hypothetical protein